VDIERLCDPGEEFCGSRRVFVSDAQDADVGAFELQQVHGGERVSHVD
jgi:hypothetical protein